MWGTHSCSWIREAKGGVIPQKFMGAVSTLDFLDLGWLDLRLLIVSGSLHLRDALVRPKELWSFTDYQSTFLLSLCVTLDE